jgi:hypothetical protein
MFSRLGSVSLRLGRDFAGAANLFEGRFSGWLQDWAGELTVGLEMLVTSSIVLVAAVLASLAAGVLVAYGVCIAMFRVFRIHAQKVAAGSARRVTTRAQVVRG